MSHCQKPSFQAPPGLARPAILRRCHNTNWEPIRRLGKPVADGESRVDYVSFAGVHAADLAEHLHFCSRSAAREVFASYSSDLLGTQRRVAIEIGASLEYLSRAVLATWNPSLLAPGNHPQSALALGNVAGDDFDHTSLRTINASGVHKLLFTHSPALASHSQEFEFVMAVRNSAAHMGFTDEASRSKALGYLVRLVGELLPLMQRTKEDFWGEQFNGLAEAIEQKYVDELGIRVASLLATAERRFQTLRSSLSDDTREATLALLESRPPRGFLVDSTQDLRVECPACARSGLLTLVAERDIGAAEVSFDVHDEPVVVAPVRGTPMLFQCPVCELVLEGDELSRVPGLGDIRALKSVYVDIRDYTELLEAQS